MSLTNNNDIPLSIAVMLATDNYDYDRRANVISATSLLNPLRSLMLQVLYRDQLVAKEIDVCDLVKSRVGSAVHDLLEGTWLNKAKVTKGLKSLGYRTDEVVVNPPDHLVEELEAEGKVLVYVEGRSEIPLGDYIIRGKYDVIFDGQVEDLKNTSTFKVTKTLKELKAFTNFIGKFLSGQSPMSAINEAREKFPSCFDYSMQGSIYRMLNPDKVTDDYMLINFIMGDWMAYRLGTDFYPPTNPFSLEIPLFSIELTKQWCQERIEMVYDENITESNIPLCSDTDLWRAPAQFKVYKDKDSKRALPKGTFDNMVDADNFSSGRLVKGLTSDVRVIPSVPIRCNYCPSSEICKQRAQFVKEGLLKET